MHHHTIQKHPKTNTGIQAVIGSFMRNLIFLLLGLICFQTALLPAAAESASDKKRAQKLVDQGMAMNDNSDAEADCYRKAIQIDPTYAAAHFNLAFIHQSRGEPENAIHEQYQAGT